ncbi:MAG: VOC family protein [Propionibacteriaceae bacterium]|jgi:catechol 2,3-dioxygenase-like lactoylglutathione lyase family enzyme|nr:VOC family protein [Propionibacteriaceae bacterium]
MGASLHSILAVFPTPDIEATARYYDEVLGFRVVAYLDVAEPHICLYRDTVEIVLTRANGGKVHPNRELYGYGEDIYVVTDNQEVLQDEFIGKGAKIVRPLQTTDYNNREFVLEDIDGRWLAFGMKQT